MPWNCVVKNQEEHSFPFKQLIKSNSQIKKILCTEASVTQSQQKAEILQDAEAEKAKNNKLQPLKLQSGVL